MKLYLVEAYWPEPILYVSCAIYIMYLAPFIFTFTLVGIVNCIRDFPCKPMCYDFYVEPEEEVEEVRNPWLFNKSNSLKIWLFNLCSLLSAHILKVVSPFTSNLFKFILIVSVTLLLKVLTGLTVLRFQCVLTYVPLV